MLHDADINKVFLGRVEKEVIDGSAVYTAFAFTAVGTIV